MRNLFIIFFECPNALYIWSWVRKIFPTSHFSNKDDLLSFIKIDGCPLVKLIKFVVITFSIWMLWRIRNYARFQDKIKVSRAISVIKDLSCLVGKSSKASMKNDMMDFSVIKFFGINTRTGKVLRSLPVRWEFSSPGWLKLTLMGLLGFIQVLPLVEVFSVGVWGSLLKLSLRFLSFRLLLLLNFMELYMLWRKHKRWDLLMSGWNVTLPWFVLRLLLGQMFIGCFVIDGILVLITVEKSGFGLLIFFGKGMRVLISWLI